MIKKLFPFLSVIMLALFVGACSSEDVMPDIDQGASSRTVTFEALMPGSGATTRVAAEELADRSIDLKWEASDEIVLLFVQGTVEENATATVVSADGKTGTFTVTLPTGISETEDYTIYGVYGSAGVPTGDKAIVNLPSTGELGKKILLRFEKTVSGNAIGSVDFVHKGYLFTAKVAITGGTVNDINLVADEGWAISSSAYTFNLKKGTFETTASAANSIDLEYFVNEDGVATAKSWFPATEEKLPALKLSVNGTVETADAKPARTPVAGEAYYLYAKYDGTDLVFDDKGTKENPFTVAEAFGAQGRSDVWVKGFIVGYKKSGGYSVEFSTDGAQASNIIIADSKDESQGNKALGIQLTNKKPARTDLNLLDNPSMYKAEVILNGDLGGYFSSGGVYDEGLLNVHNYELIDFGQPIFTADLTELDFLAVGDALTKTIKVSTNKTEAWTAESDATWLTVSPAEGTGSADVSITAATNEGAERTATVTLTPASGGLTAITIDVTQVAAPAAESKISITDLRDAYVADGTITENYYIEGEVILNNAEGNTNESAAYISDGTAGISFFFNETTTVVDDVPLGAKVKVNLLNASWDEFNGLRQLRMSTAGVTILEAIATTPLVPRVVTLQELLDKKYQSELVQIDDVQFDNVPAKYSANPNIEDADSKKVNVRTSSGATFKDENVPEGKGSFVGVVGIYNTPQLFVRNITDLTGMTGERFPFIDASPETLVFEKEGGDLDITVGSNIVWTATVTGGDGWLSITPTTTKVTATATANSTTDIREATITITGGEITVTIPVTQNAEGVVIPNDGSKERPYTVAEAIAKQGEKDVWVKGFIVGSFNNGSIFGTENASEFNLNIADDKDAIEGADIVNVQLTTTNNIRADLNLKNNSDKYKAEVLFRGDLVKYNKLPGIKNTKEYEVISLNE